MRLFIGLSVPAEIRRLIHSHALRLQEIASGKYVREDMYHITLAYIGECDESMRILATDCMRKTAAHFSPLLLAPGIPHYFGKPEKSILHLTVNNANAIDPVCKSLRKNLAASNLPFDPKPLIPHITLARNVNISDSILREIYEYPPYYSNGMTLFNSCRINDILTYVPIDFAPFSGGNPYDS